MRKLVARIQGLSYEYNLAKDTHERFLRNIEKSAGKLIDTCGVAITNGGIETTILDHVLRAKPKYIILHQSISTIEYAFKAQSIDKTITISKLYLKKNGTICSDPLGEHPVCEYGEAELALHILARVGSDLVDSELFSPSVG